MLGNTDIVSEMGKGNIVIEPFNPERMNPNSYDVSLGNWFVELEEWDAEGNPVYGDLFTVPTGKIMTFKRGRLYLGMTQEVVGGRMNITTQLHAKSTVARKGLMISPSAGFGDVGYVNHWTVVITATGGANPHGAGLVVGEPFAQISFHRTELRVINPYSGQYSSSEWPLCMLPSNQRDLYKIIHFEDENLVVFRRIREGDKVRHLRKENSQWN